MDPFPNRTVDTLDSGGESWGDILNEFSGEPLSVPQGELRLLEWMFPGMNRSLPVTQAKLQRYEPWSLTDIESFFQDYPSLRKFRPILSFESIPGMENGTVWMNSQIKEEFSPGNQRVRLKTQRPGFLKINAGLDIGETYLRWRRRLVSLNPSGIPLKTELGNYSFSMSDGLFYGYFPTISSAYEDLEENWKYGYTPNWNGLSAVTNIRKTAVLQTVLHTRPSETGVLAKTELAFWENVELYVGGSALSICSDDGITPDTSVVLHWGGSLGYPAASITLHSGYQYNSSGLPLLLELSMGRSESRFDFALVRYPTGVRPKLSHLRRRLENLLQREDTTSIFGLEVSGRREFNGLIGLRTRTLGAGMPSQTAVDHTGEISLLRPFPASLEYQLSASTAENGIRRELRVSSSPPVAGKLGAAFKSRLVVSETDNRTVHNELTTEAHFGPTMKMAPGIRCKTDITNPGESTFIFEYTYHAVLFEKTYARAKMVVPLSRGDEKGFRLDVGTRFGI